MNRLVLGIALAAAVAAGCGDDGGGRETGHGRGDQVTRASTDELLSRDPYMGVSCRTANSFACDRVGLAVWLREPAVKVDAAIAGREFELDDPEWSGPTDDGERRMFAGFLQPAGLLDGPLEVTPDAPGSDRWIGRVPVSATVDLRIVHDGTTTATRVEVELSPGWG